MLESCTIDDMYEIYRMMDLDKVYTCIGISGPKEAPPPAPALAGAQLGMGDGPMDLDWEDEDGEPVRPALLARLSAPQSTLPWWCCSAGGSSPQALFNRLMQQGGVSVSGGNGAMQGSDGRPVDDPMAQMAFMK